ncbi:cytochrome c-type biogenesis protein [Buttiauxella ferragutiae ATCC 51602]|jgi:heme exporter protein D|uniref:Heme exporter protein D n=1 Tax=Buttiauxella ferragutiae ATCC 51602 TaxID=1354252 RepID=A0ABX2W8G3_9ENTR|nr:heme exporter protein CcmD [Buttiauxella ferragutiae]OAT27511.1 cytochrome c-type biogenesis protein [Buttiauxella ferragutiae ATCC 51602]
MTRAFLNWGDFFAMGGYAFYVWLAVALTFIPLLLLLAHTRVQRRAILNAVRRQHAREKRIQAAQHAEGTE